MAHTITDNVTPATDKQREFLTTLLKERVVPADLKAALADLSSVSKVMASIAIGTLLKAPKNPALDAFAVLAQELQNTPRSKYAIARHDIEPALTHTRFPGGNDLLFVEVVNRGGRLFVNRLHGAVGGFSRSRFHAGDALTVLRYIQTNPFKFALLFGQHYHRCGKCAAELTDVESRRLNFGPECRKAAWVKAGLDNIGYTRAA